MSARLAYGVARRAIGLKIAAYLAPVLAVVVVLALLMLGAGGALTNANACADSTGGGLSLTGGSVTYPLAEGSYRISSPYGPRPGGFHRGVDFAAPLGTPDYAVTDGIVAAVGPATGFGTWFVMDTTLPGSHAKVSFVYGHMPPSSVTQWHVGDVVKAGQQVAVVGQEGEATGPHLHFEVWLGGRLTGGQDTDPIPWLQANLGTPGAGGAGAPAPAPGSDGGVLTGPVPPQGQQAFFAPVAAEQQQNTQVIVGVAKGRGLPLRAAVIAVAAAAQESGIRNINYGDRDSLGLFQQRPSQGWGTPAQILNPVYATGKFLDGLVSVAGWQTLPLTDAIQRVQRSAFGSAYAKWETQAANLVAAAAGVPPIAPGAPAPATCTRI